MITRFRSTTIDYSSGSGSPKTVGAIYLLGFVLIGPLLGEVSRPRDVVVPTLEQVFVVAPVVALLWAWRRSSSLRVHREPIGRLLRSDASLTEAPLDRSSRARDSMALTTRSASLPTPRSNEDDPA